MKEFAMKIWEMPADEFAWQAAIFIFGVLMLYEAVIEIRANRVKRFTRLSR
ncbi:MAG TPA: hypothetical protein VFF26_14755 [Gallionella sp.]|nr:hypothetical protein [Gallionella sp.]